MQDIKAPACPCMDCENRTQNCRKDCAAYHQYESDYAEYDAKKREAFYSGEKSSYRSDRHSRFVREKLNDQKRGKRRR